MPVFILLTVLGDASFVDPICHLCFVCVFPGNVYLNRESLVCHSVLSLSCSLLVTSWERADPLDLLYMLCSLRFCHFPIWCPVSGVVVDCNDPEFAVFLTLLWTRPNV